MKSFYLLFLVLTSSYASAADFGLLIGAGQTQVRGDNISDDIQDEIGLRFGIPMRFDLSADWKLRTGAIYASRKYQVAELITLNTANQSKYDMRFEYLDVPVLAEYQLTDGMSLSLGPILAFNTGARAKGTLNGNQIDDNINEISKSPYFLGQVALSFQWGHFGLDISYERGLSSFSEDEDSYMDFIGLQVSYWFNAGQDSTERGNFRYQRSRP